MLIVCPTPIGNLGDVTQRQREALAAADVIACEDTRTTGKLLELLGIERMEGRPVLWSYHEHNERERVAGLLERLSGGEKVVLVSDAGTPTISDPGYRLVDAARKQGIEVVALPGPVAAMVALSASGLPTDRFFFEGFLPQRQGARRTRLEAIGGLGVTTIMYESPHRLLALLEDVEEVLGAAREVCVGRELTKLHEEYIRGPVHDVRGELARRDKIRGECVVLMAPELAREPADQDAQIDAKITELLDEGMRPRSIKEIVSALFDTPKSQIYSRIEYIKKTRQQD
ncbi:MAG: 16S rRNA (cytidine(1402)-2'-O)-methyltransferase [Bradymonadaceae bacterium]